MVMSGSTDSQVSVATAASSVYDGFATVQDPKQYLEAPPMLMTSHDVGFADSNALTLNGAVEQSLRATDGFRVLTDKALHGMRSEILVLQTRIQDVNNQIEVENKMREAASSLSRLHMYSDSASSGRDRDRLSRLFSPAKDKKRLSRQADGEAEMSRQRIEKLQGVTNELNCRKLQLEKRILEHHSAVLANAVVARPGVPAAGAHSASPQSRQPVRPEYTDHNQVIATPPRSAKRNSYLVGDFDFSPSSSEANDSREHNQPRHIRTHQHARSLSRGDNGLMMRSLNSQGLDDLVDKISLALPVVTPNPDKMAFVMAGFDHLMREVSEKSAKVDTLNAQTSASESRIAFLLQQLETEYEPKIEQRQLTKGDFKEKAVSENFAMDLAEERKRSAELKKLVDSQKKELEEVVSSLEDVTQLAVGYESQRVEYEAVHKELEEKVRALSEVKGKYLAASIDDSATISQLCKSYRAIIQELVANQYEESKSWRHYRVAQRDTTNALPSKSRYQSQSQSQSPPQPQELPRPGPQQLGQSEPPNGHEIPETISAASSLPDSLDPHTPPIKQDGFEGHNTSGSVMPISPKSPRRYRALTHENGIRPPQKPTTYLSYDNELL